MPPPDRGRPRLVAADAAILEATIQEMAAHGFEAMSMDAVAKAAGVSKPTIYLRHASKRQLAIAALESLRELEGVPTRVGNSTENLRRVLAYLVAQHAGRGGFALVGSVLAVEPQLPELAEELRRSFLGPRLALLEAALRRVANEQDPPREGRLSGLAERLSADMFLEFILRGRVPSGWARIKSAEAVEWLRT